VQLQAAKSKGKERAKGKEKKKSAEKTAKKPAEKRAKKHAEKKAKKPTEKKAKKHAEKKAKKPVEKKAKKHAEKKAKKPAKKKAKTEMMGLLSSDTTRTVRSVIVAQNTRDKALLARVVNGETDPKRFKSLYVSSSLRTPTLHHICITYAHTQRFAGQWQWGTASHNIRPSDAACKVS
jgi:outer membrane biosynthesis protein TonB